MNCKRLAFAFCGALAFVGASEAQEANWPNRPITLVVPYAAGGPVDTVARILASRVTELLGQGVNGVTGDYSRGASGFWVEGGELAYPVHEVTIAGNLREMYRGVVAIGADVDRRASLQTGSWLLGEMTIAGE